MHKELADYELMLKDAKFKVTKKRLRMIELFMEDERYLSAKEIQEMMNKEYPGIRRYYLPEPSYTERYQCIGTDDILRRNAI